MSSTAFLFPGQGAQTVGMCRDLYNDLPAARSLFDRAEVELGFDLAEICFNGPEEKLNATDISQPALYVCSMAAVESLKASEPDVVESVQYAAGLSLGEYSAIAFAGGISFEDGLKLVRKRGQAMQAASDATPSGMVSILGLDSDQVQLICDAAREEGEIMQMANFLCPGNIAVSGHKASCDVVLDISEEMGAMKSVPLTVAGAFHTEIMRSAVDQLKEALEQVEIQPLRIPVYTNVDAKPHTDPEEIRALLLEQVCSPVLWQASMQAMLDEGVEQFYEVGPGRVLRSLLKRLARKTPCVGTLA